MKFKVVTTQHFEREAKPLIKKYRSLKDELSTLITELEQDPENWNSSWQKLLQN